MNSQTTATPMSAPVYTILDGEFTIDAPVKDVWPHLLNFYGWQNFSVNKHISGKPGAEGEVILLKKEEPGSSPNPYYARTIKLEPERRIMWKTYPEAGNYFGIVEFKLDDVGGKTRFSYHMLYENTVCYQDEAELAQFREFSYGRFEKIFAAVFPKLKKLAEKTA